MSNKHICLIERYMFNVQYISYAHMQYVRDNVERAVIIAN